MAEIKIVMILLFISSILNALLYVEEYFIGFIISIIIVVVGFIYIIKNEGELNG